MKIVINGCFGGFSLSAKAVRKYAELSGFNVFAYGDRRFTTRNYNADKEIVKLSPEQENSEMVVYWIKEDLGDVTTSEALNAAEWFHERDIKRDDKILVKVVKELKKEANGRCANLKVVTVPDDVKWEIDEYDGLETIDEVHRSWS